MLTVSPVTGHTLSPPVNPPICKKNGCDEVRHAGGTIALILLSLMLPVLWGFGVQQDAKPTESPLRELFLSLPEKHRNDPHWLFRESEARLAAGSGEIDLILLNGVARIAIGDVEGFREQLRKAARLRFYKFEKPPLHAIQPFINELLNHLRDREALLRRINQKPDRAFLHYQLGCLLLPVSSELALAPLEKAVSLDRKYYDAWRKLAITHEERMDWERAEAVWERIVLLKPEDFRPFLKVAEMRIRRGDFNGALSWYREGLTKKLYKEHYEPFRQIVEESIARLDGLRSQREVALRTMQKLREALRDMPHDTGTIHEIARIHLEGLEDIRTAEMWCNRGIRQDDTDHRFFLMLYKIYSRLGQNREAMDHLIAAIHEGPATIRAAYLNDLRGNVERLLLADALKGKTHVDELVDYFSMHY